MCSRQIFLAFLSTCLTLQYVAAVVNTGPSQNIENIETKETTNADPNASDLKAESSESSNRREAPAVLDSYGPPPSIGNLNLPVPVYGVPDAPSNNIVYPAPPPDIPPPPPNKIPGSLYGPPSFGKVYGAPQVNYLPSFPKGIGGQIPIKYNSPQFSFNYGPPKPMYGPPKPVYGPPKPVYGTPGKPFKFNQLPPKNFGFRPPKPVYGPPSFNNNKPSGNINFFSANNFNNVHESKFSNYIQPNKISSLHLGVSGLNQQYGTPILPPKPQYGTPALSTQYGVPEKNILSVPIDNYGPPQPSPNPRPPHPGAPAPPTPPDIKYDGWQPIPGLVSRRPEEAVVNSAYTDLSPPAPDSGHDQNSDTYGPPPVTLELSKDNGIIGQSGLSDSYGVPLNSGSRGPSDSYNAPLGTVTGSGGVVASSGDEVHGGGSNSQSSSHNLNVDLSSISLGHGSDIQAIKSLEYNLTPQQGNGNHLTDSYGVPLNGGGSYTQTSFSNSGTSSHDNYQTHSSSNTIGLVPPGGVYGAPPSSQYGTPSYTNSDHGSHSNINSHSAGNTYLPTASSSNTHAVSFQNLVHGSSNAGFQNSFNIQGASALPLTSYNLDGGYDSSNGGDLTVSLDYSHPPVSIDLTEGKHSSGSAYDCFNKQQLSVPPLAYGVPSADSYTSSLSSLTTNLATSQSDVQSVYGTPNFGGSNFQISVPSSHDVTDTEQSSSIKSESKLNILEESDESHGKNYGKSVAASFGPNSELVESQSLDLNNIPLQGNLGSYTLQIQSANGDAGQVSHTQVLNEGLLQSILQAIEQPGNKDQNSKYPIILQPSLERENYSYNETISTSDDANQQSSEIREVIVDAPAEDKLEEKHDELDSEETLQLLDTSNIALYYKKKDEMVRIDAENSEEGNSVEEKKEE